MIRRRWSEVSLFCDAAVGVSELWLASGSVGDIGGVSESNWSRGPWES